MGTDISKGHPNGRLSHQSLYLKEQHLTPMSQKRKTKYVVFKQKFFFLTENKSYLKIACFN